MRLRSYSNLLAIAIVFHAGCSRQESVAEPGAAPIAASAKLEAALAIINPVQRDDALSAVAQVAAEAGNGGIAMAAVVAIANPTLKDDSAAMSSGKLAKAGKGVEATSIARIIQNPIMRDKTLLELSNR